LELTLVKKDLTLFKTKYLELRNKVVNCRDCSVGHNNISSEEEETCEQLKDSKKEKKWKKIKKKFADSDSSD
jgi:hypothetical protein